MSRSTVPQVENTKLQGFINNNKLMDLVFFVESGSALWGLKDENSDTDFTGVYVPSIEECITNSFNHVITADTNPGTTNTSEDVDIKLFSIHHFVKNLMKGDSDTVAILFAPNSCFEFKDERWDRFKHLAPRIISRSTLDSAVGGAKSRLKAWEKTENPKMIYHACRFMYIAVELLKHRKVPLPIRPEIKELFQKIKTGNTELGLKTFDIYWNIFKSFDEYNLPKANMALGNHLILSFYQ